MKLAFAAVSFGCCATLVTLSGCQQGGIRASGVPSASAQASTFDQIRALEGEWVIVKVNGEVSTDGGTISYKTGSNGSSIREIMFPGSQHEMTNMYHMNGDTMMMTHYCGAGNQPRMRAVVARPAHIELKTESVTNLATAATEYMGELTLDMPDANSLKQTWTSIKDGEATTHVIFEFRRK